MSELSMPSVEVITALISSGGTLLGALGGITLTEGISARREARQAARQREADRVAAQQQAYADLLSAAAQMRVNVETTCQRYWKDMNVRLTKIQDHATAVCLHAYRAALLSPPQVASAARALGDAASNLSAWAADNTELGDFSGPDNQFLGGEMRDRPDLTAFDMRADEFFALVSGSAAQASVADEQPLQTS